MPRFHFIAGRKLLVVLSTIMLVLWTNFAVIHHQLDLDKTHHEHHHCQLFTSVMHGAKSSLPTLTVNLSPEPPPSLADYHYMMVPVITQSARAPPRLI